MRGLESVGATEPHLVVTAGGVVGCCKLTFVDGIVGHVLGVVDAAEKLVGLRIAGLCGDIWLRPGGCFIDAALLEKCIGLGYIGQEKANAEEEEKRKGKTDTGQGCRDEHD